MNRRRVSTNVAVLVGIFLVVAFDARADMIQLSSGQEVKATVTKYKNSSFEVRTDDGKITTLSSNNVKRIAFDPHTSPSRLTTRTYGAQEGNVSTYENGSFNVTQPSGTRTFPAIFVDQAEFVAERGQSIEVITHGQQVDISKHLALGNVTVIDYYADWCGPCKMVSPALEQMANSDPEIALRKVDIVNWSSAVVKQYKIHSIPRVEVYDRKGQLVGAVSGADAEQVRKYVAQAKTR